MSIRGHPPGFAQRQRQDRPASTWPAPGRARRRTDFHRRHAQDAGRRRTDGARHSRGDRLSRNARRPGQDAAPARPRRHPGRPRQPRAPGHAQGAQHRADRPGGLQPLSLRGDVARPGSTPRGDHREHRHRRPDHGPGGRQELPRRRRRHRPGAIRRHPRGVAAQSGVPCRWRPASGWRRARLRSRIAAYDRAISRLLRRRAGGEEPGRADCSTCTSSSAPSLRYGENPHQQAAFYVEPRLPARLRRHGRNAARQRTVIQQYPRPRKRPEPGPRVRRAGGRRHQAQQPLRAAVAATWWKPFTRPTKAIP